MYIQRKNFHIVYTTNIVYTMICSNYKWSVIYNMKNWACYIHQIMHIQQMYVIYNLKCYIQQEISVVLYTSNYAYTTNVWYMQSKVLYTMYVNKVSYTCIFIMHTCIIQIL